MGTIRPKAIISQLVVLSLRQWKNARWRRRKDIILEFSGHFQSKIIASLHQLQEVLARAAAVLPPPLRIPRKAEVFPQATNLPK
jgi:hypothetical protein